MASPKRGLNEALKLTAAFVQSLQIVGSPSEIYQIALMCRNLPVMTFGALLMTEPNEPNQ